MLPAEIAIRLILQVACTLLWFIIFILVCTNLLVNLIYNNLHLGTDTNVSIDCDDSETLRVAKKNHCETVVGTGPTDFETHGLCTCVL
jgi:hypothetical protein